MIQNNIKHTTINTMQSLGASFRHSPWQFVIQIYQITKKKKKKLIQNSLKFAITKFYLNTPPPPPGHLVYRMKYFKIFYNPQWGIVSVCFEYKYMHKSENWYRISILRTPPPFSIRLFPNSDRQHLCHLIFIFIEF